MTAGRAAVFFDRDGTLNEEVSFLSRPEQLRMIVGAAEAVRSVNERGMAACVITNQSGIGRGFLTEADLVPIHAKLTRELDAAGARIDRIYYCPHHPTDGIPPYNVTCECRKPRPGMLLKAAGDFGLDLSKSYVVGDRIVDVQVAQATGGKGILVLTGFGIESMEECRAQGVRPDYIAASAREAVAYILDEGKGERSTND